MKMDRRTLLMGAVAAPFAPALKPTSAPAFEYIDDLATISEVIPANSSMWIVQWGSSAVRMIYPQ